MRQLQFIMFLPGFLLFQAIPDGRGQDLKINEVQYVNRHTLFDSEGDTPDWIEIINAGETIVNLKGYQLTDDTTNKDGWIFPDHSLSPDSMLLIFASGKDKFTEGELHADFKLRLMDDPVILLSPSGSILDRIDARCVPPDRSMGRWPDSSDELKVLLPTPGTSNNQAAIEIVRFQKDSLLVSHQGGFYKDQLEVSLSNLNHDNKIHYTLDGSVPDDRSNLYEESISLKDISCEKNRFANQADSEYSTGDLITKANILRALVISDGCPASPEIQGTYFINESGKLGYKVPVVCLITEDDNLFDEEIGIYTTGKFNNFNKHGKEWERPVHLEVFDSQGQLEISQGAGLRIHGGGTRKGDQKSLRLYARDEYGSERFEHPFFVQKPEIESYKTLVLRMSMDWSGTMFKDELCHSLVSDMRLDYCAAQTSIVFLNGEYWGIYSLRERQDKHYVENNYGIGNIELDVISFRPEGINLEEGSLESYNELTETLASEDPLDPQFYSLLGDWFDMENMIDFYCAQFYLSNSDFPFSNIELWKVKGDTTKWRFFFNDMDGVMIRTSSAHLSDHFIPADDVQYYPDHSTYILNRALQNAEFRKQFSTRFYWLLENTFNASRVVQRISDFQDIYQPLASEHIYRWGIPEDYRSWISNVDMLRGFAFQRPQVIYEQLAENFGSPLKIYPNPSFDQISITLPYESEQVVIKIYSVTGKQLLVQKLSGINPLTLCHNLNPGAYILQVISGRKAYNGKIIVK